MNIGLDGTLTLDPDMIIKSCVFFWGQYNPSYPYNSRGFIEEDSPNRQIEFVDIRVRDINGVIMALHKLEYEGE
jgi:hypothetical protein